MANCGFQMILDVHVYVIVASSAGLVCNHLIIPPWATTERGSPSCTGQTASVPFPDKIVCFCTTIRIGLLDSFV
jgi:hypothetical protein